MIESTLKEPLLSFAKKTNQGSHMDHKATDLLYHRARTKTIATVGPACNTPEMLAKLIEASVDVFRINTAHGTREEHQHTLNNIREASKISGRSVGTLVDLGGPKIRLGLLAVEPTECHEGDRFTFIRGDVSDKREELTSIYPKLIDELEVGQPVLLADGTVSMVVVEKYDDHVVCEVDGGGQIRTRQGINLPQTTLSVPALTDRDAQNADWAAQNEVDFISLSFVRSSEDITGLRKIIDRHNSHAFAIAKIEKQEAVDHLQEIVMVSDGIMIARGDMGVETDVAQMPVLQKKIIDLCGQLGKPVIVATQMLDSMQRTKRPTRAEVTDVANAILDGADACMLSGETAIGKYPLEAVQMMNRIMHSTEQTLRDKSLPPLPQLRSQHVAPITSAMLQGAATVAKRIHAKMVVVASHSGATALSKAKQRDFIPTLGLSNDPKTLRQMGLFWGIIPLIDIPLNDQVALRQHIQDWGKANECLHPGDTFVFVAGSNVITGMENEMFVHTVS
ncbi:MAG: pyruvate kinase [Pirellulaceae bacterium]|nr:pyruvate kinase [Pirellulaceae bacterium]